MKYIVGKGEERKLYDTEKATLLAQKKNGKGNFCASLYMTNRGNYFAINKLNIIHEAQVVPMSKEEAKDYVLKIYDVDKFIEIFGEVEEA